MYYTRFNTDYCEIILAGDEKGLAHLHLNTGKGKRIFIIDEDWKRNDEFFSEEVKQINEYFDGKRQVFSIKLNPSGTEYQKKIWNELTKIKFGKTVSYKDIAAKTGNRNSSRAVGTANSKNPVPLIIPCHRVIGSSGKLTGFAHGLDIKQKLLDFESIQIRSSKE